MQNFDANKFAIAIAQAFSVMQGDESQEQTAPQTAPKQTQQKRGRGRPPKQTQVVTEQKTQVVTQQKRGRGRPPKNPALVVNTTIHKVKDNKVLTSADIERERMNDVVVNAQTRAQEKIAQVPVNGKITKVLFTACVKKEYKDKLRNMKVIALGNAYFPYDVRRETIGAPISEKQMAHYYKLRHNSEIQVPAQFAKILVIE